MSACESMIVFNFIPFTCVYMYIYMLRVAVWYSMLWNRLVHFLCTHIYFLRQRHCLGCECANLRWWQKCKHKFFLVAKQWHIVSFYLLLCSSALCMNYEICMFKGETEYHSKKQKKSIFSGVENVFVSTHTPQYSRR